ncbi:hypothetical protein ACFYP4_16845 [Streptomyces sp. NPDC005551]|uniref:Rv1733c family protein n=1 Tax=unclassified Streptomyces TaxID=2593676 RepID=UPI0033E77F74
MTAFRGSKVWLWRWRRNSLRRPCDVLEAWVLLIAWTLTVLCGMFTGLATARSVESGLARERVEWRPVTATVTQDAPRLRSAATSYGADRVWGRVRWTAPDGAAHTGQARVESGSAAGTAVTVWTDRAGRLVAQPVSASQARLRASMVGFLVGAGAASVPFAAGRLVRGRLELRRMEQWDLEWQRFGPLWGRKTS